MSLTLNMVGGGGGKLKNTDAILSVTVPTGSAITATKGAVTLTPTIWTKADDNTLDVGIFIIHASQFDSVNPWTVTATIDGSSKSQTIIINASKEYDVTLYPNMYLYKDGDLKTVFSGGWQQYYTSVQSGYALSTSSVTFNASSISVPITGGGSRCLALECIGKIDLTHYSTLNIERTQPSASGFGTQWGVRSTNTGYWDHSFVVERDKSQTTADISSLSGSYYILFGTNGWSDFVGTITYTKVWLS